MAMRGRPIDVWTLRRALRLAREVSIRHAAKACGLSRNTVRKYLRSAGTLAH